MENFRYTPLDHSQHELRVLYLLPRYESVQSSGQCLASSVQLPDGSPVHCLLEKASLKDCPEYIALSYTWGNIRLTRQILVNGKLMAVTENLEIALRHLQQEK